jgi:hypothetical protein
MHISIEILLALYGLPFSFAFLKDFWVVEPPPSEVLSSGPADRQTGRPTD